MTQTAGYFIIICVDVENERNVKTSSKGTRVEYGVGCFDLPILEIIFFKEVLIREYSVTSFISDLLL